MMNSQAMAAQPAMVDHHRGMARETYFTHAYPLLHYTVQHGHHHQAPSSRAGPGGLSMPGPLHLGSDSLRLHQHHQHQQQQQHHQHQHQQHQQQHHHHQQQHHHQHHHQQQHQHHQQQLHQQQFAAALVNSSPKQQQQLPTPSSEVGNAFDDLPAPNYEGFPTRVDFENLLNDYILSLSPKKRDKALIPQKRYDNILAVLRDPKCTTIESAQFRFWAKKMFRLVPDDHDVGVVCHEGKPVAVREQLYQVLTNSHGQAQHGGRDKTSAQVRKYYSWVPKELIARFVRNCPSCTLRRNSPLEYARTTTSSSSSITSSPPSHIINKPPTPPTPSVGLSATGGTVGPERYYTYADMPLDPRIVYHTGSGCAAGGSCGSTCSNSSG